MATELVHLTSADFEEQIDFINLVFSQAHVPHDFVNLMPTVCRPEEEYMCRNLAIKRDGKIRANVLSNTVSMEVAVIKLKFNGIGNVSTHVKETGNGLMKQLMNRAIEEMYADDVDISQLGGLRQRYQYYGYECAGVLKKYGLNTRNLRHTGFPYPADWHFEPITRETSAWLEKARELYNRQSVRFERGDGGLEDFYRYLINWFSKPFACLNGAGEMIGYLCTNAEHTSTGEYLMEDAQLEGQMLAAWIGSGMSEHLDITVMPWKMQLSRELDRICETTTLSAAHKYRIHNWDRVVKAFMELKKTCTPVADGELTIGIEGWGNLGICVEKGKICVEKVDKTPDLTLTAFEATRVIFAPYRASDIAEIPADKAMLVDHWFPLPLNCWPADGV